MTNFSIKLFGLAALGMVSAGLSYGQVSCTTQTINPNPAILVRAEGETELVSDVVLTGCGNGGSTSAAGQLTVFMSLPVTSKAVTLGTGVVGNSEAVLTITPTAPSTGAPQIYYGTVNGTVVNFVVSPVGTAPGQAFPASFSATVSNIRVNATGAGVTSAPVPVTETIFAGSNGLATLNVGPVTVGQALKSLVAPALSSTALGYVVCTGNPVTATSAPGLSFYVSVAETFGGFFKTQTGGGIIQNGEQGSLTTGVAAGVGTAASGTNISITLANVPGVASVYVPLSISYNGPAGFANLTLTTTTTPATAPAGLSAIPTSATVGGILYAFGQVGSVPVSGGVATATYTVTASNQSQVETFQVPVYVVFAANAAAAQGPVTVLESYAPTAVLTGQATTVPTFAPPTNSPLNAGGIGLCTTSILFPFVTNQIGFDTGIAIANTSLDGLKVGGGTSATPQAGTCTVSFYGAGAPTPNSITTPSISAIAGAGFAPTYAFQLSSVAPGFQGYAIAQCNFQYGHAFAFLTTAGSAGNAAVAQGYLGLVLPGTGGSLAARTAGAAEGLLQ